MSGRLLRVGLLTNIPTPYRLPLFQALSRWEGIDLEVAFNAATESNRHWVLPEPFDFRYRHLPGFTVPIRGALHLHINTGLWRWLKKGRFDCVVVGGWSAPAQQLMVPMCRAMGIPTVLWSGSVDRERRPEDDGVTRLGRVASRRLVRALVAASTGYVAYGTAAKRYLISLGADPDEVSIAFNTVDTAHWARAAATADGAAERRRLQLDGRVVFLYVGQLIPRKGIDALLEALQLAGRERDDLALVVAGAGPREAELRERCRLLGLDGRTRFVGHVAQAELPRFYAACDAVVLPSSREVWGLTINEAMASGRPVLASSAAGATEDLILRGITGWVMVPDDPTSLRDELLACARLTPQARHEMGRRAQERVCSMFSIESSAAGFVEAIHRSVGASHVANTRASE